MPDRLTLKGLLEAGSNNPRDLMAKAFFMGSNLPSNMANVEP
jgi:hypothetical protein